MKKQKKSQTTNLRTISATSLARPENVVAAEWTLPISIEWAPAGRSVINATKGDAPWTGFIITEPRDAERLDAHLQRLLAEAKEGKRSRPFIDFNHEGRDAAAIPLRFVWNDGIRLEIEWTSAGKAAVEGRNYSYVSPEFLLGDDNHPEALPSPGAIGALVNTPAFQRIERLAAQHAEKNMPTAIVESLVAAGLVPDGVTDEEKAAKHFAENIKAMQKARDENASLRSKLGEVERREKEAADKRKEEVEEEVDAAIRAGQCAPETRDIVVAAILEDPEKGRKLIRATGQKTGPIGEKPVKPSLSYGSASEEEDRIQAAKSWKEKRMLRAAWYDREQARHVKAANTIDANLVIKVASDVVISVLHGKLAPLQAFGTVLSTAPMKPLVPVVVTMCDNTGVIVGAPAISNFEQSTAVYTAKTVTPKQFSIPWNLANADIQNGINLLDAAESAASTLGNRIQQEITGLWVAANYANAPIATTIALWPTQGPKDAFGAMVNATRHHLILSRTLFAAIAYLQKQSFVLTGAEQGAQAYMFDGIWYIDNIETAAATAGTEGFACDPRAMVIAAGPPLVAPNAGNVMTTSNTTIADMNLAVQTNAWFATASRSPYISYDICFGAAVGNSAVGWIVNRT